MNVENHYVYILRCKDNTYYTGYAIDVERRIQVHAEGKGAKYTRGRGPFSLVYDQKFETRGKALSREIEIKRMSRKQKEALIMKWRNGSDDEGTTKLSETN